MLEKITALPIDKKIAGVHCIPILENNTIVMAWDKEEQLLTTIGGRAEGNESVDETIEREAFEEVGMKISSKRIPFASWYWESTDTYTVWLLARTIEFSPSTFDNEKSGYVICNFDTAVQIFNKLEPENMARIQLLNFAKERAEQLKWL